MAVPLYQPRKEDFVAEPAIHDGIGPRLAQGRVADIENPAFTHGNMRRSRLRCIHGMDATGRENGRR
ncbi:hypothetical protein NB2BOR_A40360 [Bordetella parapertussis]|nr:hypothetical protein NB2BOR_A40360 [Bordetella parapertussis]